MARVPTIAPDEDILRELRERVARLEWKDGEIEKRLHEGAESFSEIRRELRAKPMPWARISGVILAAFLAVLAWVWQAAHYPDRTEFGAVVEKVQQLSTEQTLLRDKAEITKSEQQTQNASIEKLESALLLLQQEIARSKTDRRR